jgi:hypothetical protein
MIHGTFHRVGFICLNNDFSQLSMTVYFTLAMLEHNRTT